MILLKAVPGSVLWLLEDNRFATGNLRREAEARGVAASRLVFAPRLPLAEHLAQHQAADLFSTPSPSTHTTASKALRAGLPLLTIAGETRVSVRGELATDRRARRIGHVLPGRLSGYGPAAGKRPRPVGGPARAARIQPQDFAAGMPSDPLGAWRRPIQPCGRSTSPARNRERLRWVDWGFAIKHQTVDNHPLRATPTCRDVTRS